MAEERRVIETKIPKAEAYNKCFKRAGQLGYSITANIPGERLEVGKEVNQPLWWTCVIVGFLFYIIPGVLVMIFWKSQYCKLVFSTNEDGTNIVAELKGELGTKFFNEVSGLLI